MKILWLTNIPSPYRVDFFNELGKECNLTVVFEKSTSNERDKSWQNYKFNNFKGIIMRGKSTGVDTAICFEVIKYLKKNLFDIVVVTNMSTPTGILAIEILKLKKIPFIIEGDGGIPKSGKGIKEKFKLHLNKSADMWLSTGINHDKYYETYGADKSRIYRYPFTSLKENDLIPKSLEKNKKNDLRNEINLPKDKKIVISVGSYISRKGFDVLINSWKYISKDYYLIIIGDGPERENYINLIKDNNLKNIKLIEFKEKETLKKYYKACNLFVLPTREDIWGLVINEAMAAGLPVITTDKCIAGLELVDDYKNGFIIPSNDKDSLANKIVEILSSDSLEKSMSNNNINKIKKYTIEEMVNTHIKYFKIELRKND